MQLNPQDLNVESFDTELERDPILTTTNDPTPATWCRWCPDATYTCP